MANDIAGLITADLTTLRSDARGQVEPVIMPAAGPDAGASFSATLQAALGQVNQADRQAAERLADVDSGRSDDLVGAMLASQEASLSFAMLMQVRNKVMGAVDELVKLPL